MDETQDLPHYVGHRERLKERFLKDEGKSMPDYELLELILTYAIPRKDVKEKAKALITTFGSLANVIEAPKEKLNAYGLTFHTITLLKLIAASIRKVTWQELNAGDKPVFPTADYLLDYCRACVARLDVEEFHVLFLDAHLKLIKDETMQRGTVNSVAMHPREVLKAALDCGALTVVMYHNHPSGEAEPSEADKMLTKQTFVAMSAMGIDLFDHLIITKDNYYSFKDHGLLKKSGIL